MDSVMDRIRVAAANAAASPLADARLRPSFPRVAAQSPFPPEAGPEDFLARWRSELETLTGRVYGPFDGEGVATQLVQLIQEMVGRRGDGETGGRGDTETRGHGDTAKDGGLPLPMGEAWTGQRAGPRGEGAEHPGPRTQDSSLITHDSSLMTPTIRILSWSEEEIGVPGLGEKLAQAGIEMVPGDVPNDENHQRVLEEHAALEVGLSGAVAAIADTGSIVVASGPGRSRIASLLPLIHIAVVRVDSLYPTMQEWLAAEGTALASNTANLVVITGSSRTSDIELQLTLGMHGPKEIHVVLYRG